MKTATEQPQEAVKKTVKPPAQTKPGSKSKKARVKGPSIQNRNAAGIDIGSQSHHVAVPADRDVQPVRTFRAYTCGLEEMVKWLKACRITTVAMESTGVYWIPLFQILEKRKIEVRLVNAYCGGRFARRTRPAGYAPCSGIARTWWKVSP